MKQFSRVALSAGRAEKLATFRTVRLGQYTRMQTQRVSLAAGIGSSIAQHGEILQGQLEDSDYQRHRFLVSLPCSLLHSRVTFAPARDEELSVVPMHKEKVKRVVQLTLRRFNLDDVGGVIRVESDVEEGKGYGSSTADCV